MDIKYNGLCWWADDISIIVSKYSIEKSLLEEDGFQTNEIISHYRWKTVENETYKEKLFSSFVMKLKTNEMPLKE